MACIRKRLNIRELFIDTEVFHKYFHDMMRKRGETLTKYINVEETDYRKLLHTLKEAMEGGHDEWSEDEGDTTVTKFKMPKRLIRMVSYGSSSNTFEQTHWDIEHDTMTEH